MTDIDITKIASVYSGRDGKCCCGCSGKHSYASAHRAAAGKSRGYDINDDEVSDRNVRRVCHLIMAEDNATEEGYGFTAVVGTRLYVAYKLRS